MSEAPHVGRGRVQVVPVGPLRENCCVVDDGRGGVCVVDPGAEWPLIERAIAGRPVSRILVTHFHDDHVGALNDLLAATGAPWAIGADDAPMLWPGRPRTESYLPPAALRAPDLLLKGGEVIEAGGLRLRAIACPGHSRGGMSYFESGLEAVFAGDTLFAGGAGRTDLLGGNELALLTSLARLARLPRGTCVYPGHGPVTTLLDELADNPYMQAAVRRMG